MVSPEDRNIGTFVIAYLIFHFWVYNPPLVFVAIKWIVIVAATKPVATQFGVATICGGGLSTSAANLLRGMGIEWNHVEFLLQPARSQDFQRSSDQSEADVAEYDLVTVGPQCRYRVCDLARIWC
jgi:cellobiose-specific phosphotransferase system component IIB